MEKALYLDCSAGISGDMLVGALLDLGADADKLLFALKSADAEGFEIKISKVKKGDTLCTDFDVVLDGEHENHDHDMEYLYKDIKETDFDKGKNYEKAHHTRKLADVLSIINSSAASDKAKETATRIFTILAHSEARAHEVSVEEVHFHEVGATDSIADILAVAVCLEQLNIDRIIIPSLTDGRGRVRSSHGVLPVPVPAVSDIAKTHGLLLEISDAEGELVTPTGAAAAAAVRTDADLPETYRILKTGYGAGKRQYATSGFLRACIIEVDRW